jgi:hypothetical protein
MKDARFWLLMLCLCSAAAGCAHHSVSSSLQSDMQTFLQTRDHAVTVVRAAKANAGPQAVDIVNVKYAALQQQANGYLGLVVESIDTDAFDAAKGAADAEALTKAIDGFNGSVGPLLPKNGVGSSPSPAAALPLPDEWVARLQTDLASSWPDYAAKLSALTPQQRSNLAEQLKASLAWPNFQDIAASNTP